MHRGTVVVALSGGVDSAVAAALLLQQGYRVQGVYLKYASELVHGFVHPDQCGWEDDLRAVAAVGRHLGIPVKSLNVERQYNDHVLSVFLREYAGGRTPNPDILCNRDVKFRVLLDWAKKNGFDRVASGHYARHLDRHGQPELHAGVDPEKDQSYFLYALSPELLRQIMFPLGQHRKVEVRRLARTLGLPNADRPDSQGVCFVGQMKVRDFLSHAIPQVSGPIRTPAGQYLGQHVGLAPFTVGQRRGLRIGGRGPFYVVEKQLETNTLVVAPNQEVETLLAHGCEATDSTWLVTPPEIGATVRCQARIRYRQPLVLIQAHVLENRTLRVLFHQPQRAVAPGQAIVLYQGSRVLGGATIDRPIRHHHFSNEKT